MHPSVQIDHGRGRGNPRVSVVLPVFNRADLVGRALESLARQTFRDFEIVVVDDGSTDGTASVLESLDFPLKILRHPVNLGAAAARNTGIRASSGSLIAFLDSDDCWEPEKLSRQVAALDAAAPNVRACGSGFYLYRKGRRTTVTRPVSGRLADEVLFGCSICPGTTLLVDARVFTDEEAGLFDPELRRLEDWEWLLRFAGRSEIVFVPEPLAHVYVPATTAISATQRDDVLLRAIDRIAALHLPRLRRQSGGRYRRLRSALLIERAARMHHRHQFLKAAAYVAASLAIYPWRNANFFRILARSVLSIPKHVGSAALQAQVEHTQSQSAHERPTAGGASEGACQ